MKALSTILASLVTVGAMSYSAPSDAAPVYKLAFTHAAAACTGSMAADREMIRARSMGISNIDVALADVRCGGIATPNNYDGGTVQVYETALRNSGTDPIDVNCMLADGIEDGVMTVSTKYPKTVTLQPGEVGWIDWIAALDNGDVNFVYPSLICQLPTSVSISYTAILYADDNGL